MVQAGQTIEVQLVSKVVALAEAVQTQNEVLDKLVKSKKPGREGAGQPDARVANMTLPRPALDNLERDVRDVKQSVQTTLDGLNGMLRNLR